MQNIMVRERAAVFAIGLWFATDLGVAASGAMRVASLGATGAIWSATALELVDRVTEISAVLYAVTLFLSAVCFARWLYRASANAHSVSDEMTISPGWSIGFFFVPIVNLWKPFQALRETWQVSLSPAAPDSVPVPIAMRVWWGLWLLNSVLENASFRLGADAKTVADVTAGGWLDIASIAVGGPMAVLLIILIRQLSANQRGLVDTRVFE